MLFSNNGLATQRDRLLKAFLEVVLRSDEYTHSHSTPSLRDFGMYFGIEWALSRRAQKIGVAVKEDPESMDSHCRYLWNIGFVGALVRKYRELFKDEFADDTPQELLQYLGANRKLASAQG